LNPIINNVRTITVQAASGICVIAVFWWLLAAALTGARLLVAGIGVGVFAYILLHAQSIVNYLGGIGGA